VADKSDTQTLLSILKPGNSSRIVVETKLQKFYLSASLAEHFCRAVVLTKSEFYRSILGFAKPDDIQQVSLSELCFRLIAEDTFPLLRKEIGAEGSAKPSFSFKALGPIVEFVEAYICYDDHTDIYRALIDEFGDIAGESERLAELVRLADVIAINRRAVAVSSDREARFILNSSPSEEEKRQLCALLPQQLIFYLPTQFLPLERHALAVIAKLTALDIVIARSMVVANSEMPMPSEVFLQSTITFAEDLAKSGSCRLVDLGTITNPDTPDITVILDGTGFQNCKGTLSNVSIIEVDDSEADLVANLVGSLIKSEGCSPSDIVVVALDETASSPIGDAIRRQQIPVINPRGCAVGDTPFPALFRAYINWLVEPSINTFERFYLAPQVASSLELRIAINLIRTSGLGGSIFSAESCGINDEIEQQLLAINDFAGKRHSEKLLLAGFSRINEELSLKSQSIPNIRKKFHSLRYRLRAIASIGDERERTVAARALRSFSQILRRESMTIQKLQDIYSFSAPELLRLFEQRVRVAATSSYLTEEITSDSIVLTGLLDARGLRDKTVILTGALESNFFGSGAAIDESVSGWMDHQLKRSIGAELPGAEALSIIRSLLLSSKEIYFTFKRDEGSPPRFIERLSQFSNRDDSRLRKLIGDGSRVRQERTKGAQMLLARSEGQFTEYDGLVSETALHRAGFKHTYSVSDIQTLADCPHRYYFSKILGLSEIRATSGGLLAQIGGTLTHRLLRKYFSGETDAEQILDGYKLPWDLPEYRQTRRLILGLYLPTAQLLTEQIGSNVLYTELSFRGDQAFKLAGEYGPIAISGAVDRIDLVEERDDLKLVAIWDYKTSSPAALNKRTGDTELQVPLYALAVNSMPGMRVDRGGLLLLNYPGLGENDFSDVAKGPIRDQLRLAKKSGRWAIEPDAVPGKLAKVEEIVRNIDSEVSKGNFCQLVETPHEVCSHCEFRQICARDEVVLEQKRQRMPIDVRVEPKTDTNSYRLYFDRFKPMVERIPSPQQAPAGDVSKSFVVHAGAGAGKTATMVHRVVSLLLSGCPIRSIVTVTFTKKAAAELKQRIKHAIAGAVESGMIFGRDLIPAETAMLCRAFYEIEKAQIGTIHSFCHRVLSFSPNVSRDFFRPELIDEATLRENIERIVEETVLKLPATELNALFSARLKLRELKGGLGELLSKPSEITALMRTYLCSEQRADELVSRLVERHRTTILSLVESFNSYIALWIPDIETWIATRTDLTEKQKEDFDGLIAGAKRLQQLYSPDELTSEYQDVFRELSEFANKNRGSQKSAGKKNPVNYWKELREQLNLRLSSIVSTDSLKTIEQESFQLSRRIISIAERALHQLQSYKIENGLAAFDDLIHAVRNFIISDNPHIELLRKSAQHVLIDEFQDTDAVQWEIFKHLTPATMFIVGDYQQAIYGFRGGELSVFEVAEQKIREAGGEIVVLDDNYRSRPEVIDFVNGFFGDLFRSDKTSSQVVARRMQSKRTNGSLKIEGVFRTDSGGRGNVGEASRAAEIVSALLTNKPGEEVALIARTSKQIRYLCSGLTRAKIPYVVLHSGDFYDREEIKLFCNLFTWLGYPEDNIALVGLLRSALFGYSDDEILRLFCDAESSWAAVLDSPVATPLKQLQMLARRSSAVEIIDFVMGQLDLQRTYRQVGDIAAVSNIRLLRNQLNAASRSGLNIFSSLVVAQWLNQKPAVSKDDLTSVQVDRQVKILTIHGAKGLEFSNVILPYLDRRIASRHDFIIGEFEGARLLGLKVADEDGEVRTKTFTQQLLNQQNVLKDRAEERRVFYVACTRAKDALILINNRASERDEEKGDPLTVCSTSSNPAVWLKQLVEDGDEVPLTDTISAYRAVPVNFEVISSS
jgi:ATP-dependent helicase/nuclease subunit A